MDPDHHKPLIVGIVGPCGAGKTTLIKSLNPGEIILRHIAQEHSYVPDMWKRITNPDVLIFLDVSYPVTITRKQLNWTLSEYQNEQNRLAHARSHADLYIDTTDMTITEVVEKVTGFLSKQRF
jgi:cytidylate kinase